MQELLKDLLRQPMRTEQIRQYGIESWQLTALVRESVIRRMLKGVYVHADVADSVELRLQAIRLVREPGQIIWRRTASWLYNIDVFKYAELTVIPPVEMCAPPFGNRVRHSVSRGSRIALLAQDVASFGDVPLTTPLRTALDLGSLLRRGEALAALDGYLGKGLVSTAALLAELPRFVGRRGVVQLRELVPLANAKAESPGESWARLALYDDGLPPPELQFNVRVNGENLFRLDMAWPLYKVCVEYDGEEFHLTPAARRHDLSRRGWLQGHGWIVIVVRKDDMTADRVGAWTQDVREALVERGWRR